MGIVDENDRPNAGAGPIHGFTHEHGGNDPVGSVPVGCIVIWSGAVAKIPKGWQLCNGTNGTPDLRGRFVMGSGTTSPAVGFTEGTAGVVGGHLHPIQTFRAGMNFGQPGSGDFYVGVATTGTPTIGTGDDGIPPYYVLAYIMRMS